MKKLHLALFFSLVAIAASSQKVYFFYIQSESDQPFYVKLDKKIQYASPAGYLILPKLYDSSYKITVGFPQNKWPEQNFALNVNKKDHGYVLKNVPGKGWALYDLQSMEFMMAMSGNENKTENGNVTAFTDILSKAADDPSLKEKTVQTIPEEKKAEPVLVVEPVKTETAPAQNTSAVTDPDKPGKKGKRKTKKETETETEIKPEKTSVAVVKEEPKNEIKEEVKEPAKEEIKTPVKEEVKAPVKEEVKAEIVPEKKEETKPLIEPVTKPVITQPATESELDNYKKSQVKKYAENPTTEGFGLVFVDQYENGNKDTIRLVIPNPKPVIDKVPETPKEEKKFLEISSVPTTEKTVTEEPKEEKKVKATPEKKKTETKTVTGPVVKKDYANGCADAASDNDLSKLNRKMKSVNDSEEKMIAEARKYFKTTCFSTTQVRELSTLFINDEARYNFFDLAYKYVIDPDNFASLQTEIKDLYYQSRFKAMLRN